MTNADGSVSRGLADLAASNLYYTVGVCPNEYGNYESVSVSNGNGFAPDGVSFLLAEGVTNTLPLRVGQRYVFESFWPEYWKILTDDPAIVCTTNLDEMTLTVYRSGETLELTVTVAEKQQSALEVDDESQKSAQSNSQMINPWQFFFGGQS